MNMNKFVILVSLLGLIAYAPVMMMIIFSLNNLPETSLFYKPLVIVGTIGFFCFGPMFLTFFSSIDIEESKESD